MPLFAYASHPSSSAVARRRRPSVHTLAIGSRRHAQQLLPGAGYARVQAAGGSMWRHAVLYCKPGKYLQPCHLLSEAMRVPMPCRRHLLASAPYQ